MKLLGFTLVFPTRLTFLGAQTLSSSTLYPQELAQLAHSRCPLSAHWITWGLHLTVLTTALGIFAHLVASVLQRVAVDEEQRL